MWWGRSGNVGRCEKRSDATCHAEKAIAPQLRWDSGKGAKFGGFFKTGSFSEATAELPVNRHLIAGPSGYAASSNERRFTM